ncbi:MAG: 3-deoxy-D-manno-octulosonic acid transferase [Candidatus Omnitrophota bacterium]
MNIVYDAFFMAFSVLYLPYFIAKGKWRGFSRQRFGVFPEELLSRIKGPGTIWMHAVSVGEVIASLPLYDEIRRSYPSARIVISTVTPTGNHIARERFKGAAVIYLPLDLSFITDKVAGIIKPEVLLIAETEIWPNLISSVKRSGAKIIIFNGRLSKYSFKNYSAFRTVLKKILGKIDLFLMQSQADAERVIYLGAPEERVKVSGNLKFDAALTGGKADERESFRKKLGLSPEESLLIAGSTHPGEEEIILRCYKQLARECPRLRLLIAPRHAVRFPAVAGCVKAAGLKARSVSKSDHIPSNGEEVYVLDVMGILARLYSAGDMIFMGGSLIKKGGQNPLEAAYYSKAVLFGPHMHNFEGIAAALLSEKAAMRVADEEDLIKSVRMLLHDPAGLRAMGERARSVLESNAGVAEKDLELIEPFFGKI